MNAREANKQVAAGEEERRREEFEKQSERKRQALRRAQEAAAEARRRAEEARRLRQEAEYLAQFGELPPDAESPGKDVAGGNEPGAVIIAPAPSPARQENATGPLATPPDRRAEEPSAAADAPADLEAVREELRRRNEE